MPDYADQPLTHEDMAELRIAGASPEFLRVVSTPAEAVGVERNGALEEARQVANRLSDGSIEDLAGTVERGGDFFQALWRGNIMEAFYHADIDHTLLLTRLFTPHEFLAAARDNPRDNPESAKRVLVQKWRRHGDDGTELPPIPDE